MVHFILRFFFLISKLNTVDSVSGDREKNKDKDAEGESEQQKKTEKLHQFLHGFEEAGKS